MVTVTGRHREGRKGKAAFSKGIRRGRKKDGRGGRGMKERPNGSTEIGDGQGYRKSTAKGKRIKNSYSMYFDYAEDSAGDCMNP